MSGLLGAYVLVLGIAQDGGYPQSGCTRPDRLAAWKNPKLRRHVASLGIVDPASHQQWIIDATPDFPEQLHVVAGSSTGPRTRPGQEPGFTLDPSLLTPPHLRHHPRLPA